MPLVADHVGREAPPEHVPAPPVTLVERLGVEAVQPLHAGGEVRDLGREDEVVMRVHQAVRVQPPGVLLAREQEQVEEIQPIQVGDEDRSPPDAVARDVEDTVGEAPARLARHDADASVRPSRPEGLARVRAQTCCTPTPEEGLSQVWCRVCPSSVP